MHDNETPQSDIHDGNAVPDVPVTPGQTARPRTASSADSSGTDLRERVRARLEILGLLEEVGLAQEVIDVFFIDAGQSMDKLAPAVAERDAKSCERLAHRIRGSSLNLGMDRLGDMARALEETAKAGDLTQAAALFESMRREFANLRAIVPDILRRAA